MFFAIRLAVDHHLIDILSFKFAQVYVVRIRVVILILPNQYFVEFCLGHAFFVISNLTWGRKLQVLHRLSDLHPYLKPKDVSSYSMGVILTTEDYMWLKSQQTWNKFTLGRGCIRSCCSHHACFWADAVGVTDLGVIHGLGQGRCVPWVFLSGSAEEVRYFPEIWSVFLKAKGNLHPLKVQSHNVFKKGNEYKTVIIF